MDLHSAGVRIAMWSGPRNISTALMRSWESRDDTIVCDEPLYAHYLGRTGIAHPGREEVLAHHDTDWRKVVAWLTGPVPDGKAVFYQKHMAHHLLPEIDRDWLDRITNAFLIRDPSEMITSLIRVLPEVRVEDTGLPQQWELFEAVRESTGETPAVIDSRDVLEHPREMLELLCTRCRVPFSESMLAWKPGPRATDGVWAKHWYASVEESTGFQPYRPKDERVPERLRAIHDECSKYYENLHRHRIRVEVDIDPGEVNRAAEVRREES